MLKLVLERFYCGETYTEGQLMLDDLRICWTLERAYKNNAPNISCIPEDTYELHHWVRPSGADSYIVLGNTVGPAESSLSDTVTRWGILIHPANKPEQLQGCIAPGLSREHGRVWESRKAMDQLLDIIGTKQAELTIIRL